MVGEWKERVQQETERVTTNLIRAGERKHVLTVHSDIMYNNIYTMSPRELTALRLTPELLEAMRAYKDREGLPITAQVEKAVVEWLRKRGVVVKKAERKRVAARKRP